MLVPKAGRHPAKGFLKQVPYNPGRGMGKVTGAEVRGRKCWKQLLLSPSTPLHRSSSHPTGEGSPAPSLQSCFGQSPLGIPTLQRGNLQRAWLWALTGGMVGITDGKNRLERFCRLAPTQDKIKHPDLSLGKGQKQKMLSDLYLGASLLCLQDPDHTPVPKGILSALHMG